MINALSICEQCTEPSFMYIQRTVSVLQKRWYRKVTLVLQNIDTNIMNQYICTRITLQTRYKCMIVHDIVWNCIIWHCAKNIHLGMNTGKVVWMLLYTRSNSSTAKRQYRAVIRRHKRYWNHHTNKTPPSGPLVSFYRNCRGRTVSCTAASR